MLYVNSVEYTPDGRSLVKTIGERRFRVVRRDVVDGYDRAWIELVFDERVTDKSEIGESTVYIYMCENHVCLCSTSVA